MRHDYTITEGEIKNNNQTRKIPFALVFNDDGLYYIETFLPDREFYDQTERMAPYTIKGKTEKGYDIEITELYMRQFKFSNRKLNLVCHGYICLSENRKEKEELPGKENYDDSIYVVELEGMKMKFGDHTTIEKHRRQGEETEHFEFDHTSCAMSVDFAPKEGNYFHLIFTKSPDSENIIMDFSDHKGYNRLTYKNYRVIKDTLLSFLSFINGGHVFIRKEFTGWYVTSSKNDYIDAQVVYHYSKNKETAGALDDFVPINEHHSFSGEIVPFLFVRCFDAFYQFNKTLDFISLVFSLNNSTQTAGLDEKYFILITALERICSNYARTLRPTTETLISNELFTEIKTELETVLKKYEAKIKRENGGALSAFGSKIGNLNRTTKNDTAQKLRDLFVFAKIPLNKEVESLIGSERNMAVHEGVIGLTEQQKVRNYLKLDHILRDIILNLIGYEKQRRHTFKYFESKSA